MTIHNLLFYIDESSYSTVIFYVCFSVDGGWSSWSSWSSCTKLCNGGERVKTRQCNKPTPSSGGAECEGERKVVERCNDDVPCPGTKYMIKGKKIRIRSDKFPSRILQRAL